MNRSADNTLSIVALSLTVVFVLIGVGFFTGRYIYAPKETIVELKRGDIVQGYYYDSDECIVISKDIMIDYFSTNGRYINGNNGFTYDILNRDIMTNPVCEDHGLNRKGVWDDHCKVVGYW